MSLCFLIPVDDSDVALLPVRWLVKNLNDWRKLPQVHLLNVQAALPEDIGRFVNAETIREFHVEAGMKALKPASDILAAAGLKAETHVLVGHAAKSICDFADKTGCSQILLGAHTQTGLLGAMFGSVTMKVAHHAHVPVTLIR